MAEAKTTNKDYTVLIVENDIGTQALLREFLGRVPKTRARNIEVLVVDSVQAALEQFENRRNIDIVLLDYVGLPSGGLQIPGDAKFPGDYIAQKIRRSNPYIYIVGMTGYGEERSIRTHAMQNGANYFLEKPIERAEFDGAIDAALNRFESFYDPLTGLLNRKGLETRLEEEINRARRYEHPLALMMVDIDRFKPYNDTYGHQQGDEALVHTAGILAIKTRKGDIVARVGGEEFTVVLPETGEMAIQSAVNLCEAVRLGKIETYLGEESKRHIKYLGERGPQDLTVSIGVTIYPRLTNAMGDELAELLIRHADRALYTAKNLGRDRAVFYSPPS